MKIRGISNTVNKQISVILGASDGEINKYSGCGLFIEFENCYTGERKFFRALIKDEAVINASLEDGDRLSDAFYYVTAYVWTKDNYQNRDNGGKPEAVIADKMPMYIGAGGRNRISVKLKLKKKEDRTSYFIVDNDPFLTKIKYIYRVAPDDDTWYEAPKNVWFTVLAPDTNISFDASLKGCINFEKEVNQ